jgi:anti-sigma regulatory factor (Ser/Thr protein kinase)
MDQKFNVSFAIYEMLINAIEHGNCAITYQEKSAWMQNRGAIVDLIQQKCADPKIAARKVAFDYGLGTSHARFVIADEGEGFDCRSVKDPTAQENLYELHGRGILMSKQFTTRLEYNDKGNEVRFEIEYSDDESLLTPALLKNMKSRELVPGDIVFKQGDPGDFLYYIAKGRYEVVANDRDVSVLTPDDIFMGEMSFLLNNRRTATVRAQTPGKLIEISKRGFVNAIKEKPHYALFLSRLLAQRIQRSNLRKAL